MTEKQINLSARLEVLGFAKGKAVGRILQFRETRPATGLSNRAIYSLTPQASRIDRQTRKCLFGSTNFSGGKAKSSDLTLTFP
jgi:hypothetical protein